jgi:hypothetical protein
MEMKILKKFSLGFLIFFAVLFMLFFVGKPPQAKEIKWGVNFSQKHCELWGMDYKKVYLALLDDLQVKRIKLITYWDKIEKKQGEYNFSDVDWQIKEAQKRDAQILLVIGMKTPRWPECHIPQWAKDFSKEEQQARILKLLNEIVLRYRDVDIIWGWQVENEPFFPFGDCPWADEDFVKKEVDFVKALDFKKRPVLISDSGEGSFWIDAARTGDMVGTTLYKKVWVRQLGIYFHYPFPEMFYWRKAWIIEKLFHEKVICVELQAEPWGPTLLYDSSLEEQEKSMNLEQFKNVIGFASRTGFDEFYLWGAEWWFWLKQEHNDSRIWEEAGLLFRS